MGFIKNCKTIRPLLSVSRFETGKLCSYWQLPIYPDKSNQKTKFLRNRIRKQIVPIIKLFFNSQLENVLLQLSEIVEAENRHLDQVATNLFPLSLGKTSLRRGTASISSNTILAYHTIYDNRIATITTKGDSEAKGMLSGGIAPITTITTFGGTGDSYLRYAKGMQSFSKVSSPNPRFTKGKGYVASASKLGLRIEDGEKLAKVACYIPSAYTSNHQRWYCYLRYAELALPSVHTCTLPLATFGMRGYKGGNGSNNQALLVSKAEVRVRASEAGYAEIGQMVNNNQRWLNYLRYVTQACYHKQLFAFCFLTKSLIDGKTFVFYPLSKNCLFSLSFLENVKHLQTECRVKKNDKGIKMRFPKSLLCRVAESLFTLQQTSQKQKFCYSKKSLHFVKEQENEIHQAFSNATCKSTFPTCVDLQPMRCSRNYDLYFTHTQNASKTSIHDVLTSSLLIIFDGTLVSHLNETVIISSLRVEDGNQSTLKGMLRWLGWPKKFVKRPRLCSLPTKHSKMLPSVEKVNCAKNLFTFDPVFKKKANISPLATCGMPTSSTIFDCKDSYPRYAKVACPCMIFVLSKMIATFGMLNVSSAEVVNATESKLNDVFSFLGPFLRDKRLSSTFIFVKTKDKNKIARKRVVLRKKNEKTIGFLEAAQYFKILSTSNLLEGGVRRLINFSIFNQLEKLVYEVPSAYSSAYTSSPPLASATPLVACYLSEALTSAYTSTHTIYDGRVRQLSSTMIEDGIAGYGEQATKGGNGSNTIKNDTVSLSLIDLAVRSKALLKSYVPGSINGNVDKMMESFVFPRNSMPVRASFWLWNKRLKEKAKNFPKKSFFLCKKKAGKIECILLGTASFFLTLPPQHTLLASIPKVAIPSFTITKSAASYIVPIKAYTALLKDGCIPKVAIPSVHTLSFGYGSNTIKDDSYLRYAKVSRAIEAEALIVSYLLTLAYTSCQLSSLMVLLPLPPKVNHRKWYAKLKVCNEVTDGIAEISRLRDDKSKTKYTRHSSFSFGARGARYWLALPSRKTFNFNKNSFISHSTKSIFVGREKAKWPNMLKNISYTFFGYKERERIGSKVSGEERYLKKGKLKKHCFVSLKKSNTSAISKEKHFDFFLLFQFFLYFDTLKSEKRDIYWPLILSFLPIVFQRRVGRLFLLNQSWKKTNYTQIEKFLALKKPSKRTPKEN